MTDMKQFAICKAVESNRKLFEDVAKGYENAKDAYSKYYMVLNYDMILDQMMEYLDGYQKYSNGDDKKYDGKVLTITHNFYDKMFTDKKYRKKIQIKEFQDMTTSFLKKTKQLKSMMETILNDKDLSAEMNQMVRLTDNQYKKVARVHADDMKIYLWITTAGSQMFAYNIDQATKTAYYNKNTPVMHELKYTRG